MRELPGDPGRPQRELILLQLGLYVVGLVGLAAAGAALALEGGRLTAEAARSASVAVSRSEAGTTTPPAATSAPRTYSRVLDDSWNEALRSQKFWGSRRSSAGSGGFSAASSPPMGLFGAFGAPVLLDPLMAPERSGRRDLYTTVCVRLCDGSYTPVSHSTTADRFERDEAACTQSCNAPTRLFVYRTHGGSVESMEDLRGQPYARLPTAFVYRTSYNPACKCRPHPWEQEARDRHQLHALEARARKGDRAAVAEARVLREKVNADQRAALEQRRLDAQNPQRYMAAALAAQASVDQAGSVPSSIQAAQVVPQRRAALATTSTLDARTAVAPAPLPRPVPGGAPVSTTRLAAPPAAEGAPRNEASAKASAPSKARAMKSRQKRADAGRARRATAWP